MAALTVAEASATYERAMRNPAPPGQDVCPTCSTFFDGLTYSRCYGCNQHPNYLDAVIPITYSEHLLAMHHALRSYKDGVAQVQRYAMVRLAAILWRFLGRHEPCIEKAAGVAAFDLVTTVPSSTPQDDDARSNFRTMVGWCDPIKDRFDRILSATGNAAPGRAFDSSRYAVNRSITGERILLLDDTWASGGHAQSAACTLRTAGAASVALVVIGRHVRRDWEIRPGTKTGELLDALPTEFDWDDCAVH